MRWVAVPPPGAATPLPTPRRARYLGPPSYRSVPRWGFPALPWPRPPADEPRPGWQQTDRAAQPLVPLLRATAAAAALAVGAEVWRYVLLVQSRSGALGAGTVSASDVLVTGAGWVATVLGLLSGVALVHWSVRAAVAAAARGGHRPSRSVVQIVVGWIVPGVNLSVPGSVLAEIEHGALDRPAGERPRPSPLLRRWWTAWACGVVLAIAVAALSLRTGVQARADGVLLHALVDAVAVVVALLSARVVTLLTDLLAPPRSVPREIVVQVRPLPSSS